jgi:type I restriction enzyme S subunit
MSFPKYETYKDSGVEWLGEVPSHWDLNPGRVTLSLNKEKNAGNIENTVLSLSYGRLVVKPPEKLTGLVPESFEGYQIINPGDIIIRPTDLQNDWTSLRVGLASERGIITSAYLGLRHDDKVSSKYLYYLLHSYDLLKVYYGMGTGLRQNLDWRDFKYLILTFPPKPEQDRIVAFLDEKTAQINKLIAKKERQIELLEEQKTIRINQAVTRGLNPNVKLKPSGIEWIGDIPEHWEVNRLFSVFNERVETGYGELPMLNITISRGVSVEDFKGDRPKRLIEDRNTYKRAAIGDIAYNMMRMWQGAVGDVQTEGLVSPAYVVARPIRPINSSYFSALFRGEVFQIETNKFSYGIVSDRNRLYWQGFKSISVPIPPLKEQDQIANGIMKLQKQIKSAQEALKAQIANFKTLRSTLIAHAVTGKIKV